MYLNQSKVEDGDLYYPHKLRIEVFDSQLMIHCLLVDGAKFSPFLYIRAIYRFSEYCIQIE